VETDNGKQAGATRFTIVLETEPGIDAIRNLHVALRVLKCRCMFSDPVLAQEQTMQEAAK